MFDIKEEKNNALALPPPAVPSAAPEAAPSQPASLPAPEPRMSSGEKWYNRIVYQGINYWLNLGMSLYIADIFLHGGKADISFGKASNLFKWSTGGISTLLHNIGVPHGIAKRTTDVVVGTFTLNSGGNVLLIPMKWLEDRKRPVVHWLNKHVFKEQQPAADGHEKTPGEIHIEEEQPPQSWPRVLGRRALACLATMVTGLGIDMTLARKGMVNGEKVTIEEGTERFGRWVRWLPDKAVNKIGWNIAPNGTADRYMKYAALDTFYTMITSKVMHMTNGARKASDTRAVTVPPADAVPDSFHLPPDSAQSFAAREEEKKQSRATEAYKSKKIEPVANYAALAARDDQNHSMSPSP